jgi:hypothetical protein
MTNLRSLFLFFLGGGLAFSHNPESAFRGMINCYSRRLWLAWETGRPEDRPVLAEKTDYFLKPSFLTIAR